VTIARNNFTHPRRDWEAELYKHVYIFIQQNGSIKNTFIQKHTINKNGSRNRNKETTICTIRTTGYYNMSLFVAMETVKSLPLAEVRQIINHRINLQFTEYVL